MAAPLPQTTSKSKPSLRERFRKVGQQVSRRRPTSESAPVRQQSRAMLSTTRDNGLGRSALTNRAKEIVPPDGLVSPAQFIREIEKPKRAKVSDRRRLPVPLD